MFSPHYLYTTTNDENAPIMKAFFLLRSWPKWLDVIAGVTVGIVSLPQAMAFSLLAGMPPIYGLYGALIPPLVYAFFGTSAFLNVGPVSVVSIFAYSLVAPLYPPFSSAYINVMIQLGLLVGLIQWMTGFVGVGKYISLLPKSIISGFIQAAAVVIIVSQLSVGFGIPLTNSSSLLDTVIQLAQQVQDFHTFSTVLFVSALAVLFLGKHFFPNFHTTIVLLVFTGICAFWLDWEGQDILLIGEVPQGFPQIILPQFSRSFFTLLPGAIGLAFIATVGSYVMAKTLEEKQSSPYVADQDFMALGVSKIIASFFGALLSAGSFNRSILNLKLGATSQYASLFSALIVGLTLVFFTPLVYFLPQPVIAAIIVYSAFFLFDFSVLRVYWKNDKKQLIYFTITVAITLGVGFVEGIFAGIAIAVLGRYFLSQPT